MEAKLIAKLKNIYYTSGNETFRGIAKYLLNNSKDSFNDFSIMKLSKKTFTSPATITRFCNELEYEGFKELHFLLKIKGGEYVQKDDCSSKTNMDIESSLFFKDNLISSLKKTFDNNINKLAIIKDKISSDKRIYFFGIGNNNFLMKTVVHTLIRLDFNVIYSSIIEQQSSYVENMKSDDFAIVISMSLSDPFFYELSKNLKIKKTPCYYITKNIKSELLAGIPNDNIFVVENKDNIVGAKFSSEIIIMFLLKLMVINLVNIDDIENTNKKFI
ncbi:MurR/RpiR family transcriptional regulator [Spiroplasma endosymbiont of Aspidapion aeneum]|uniref:MurR/RpiR family transcriptional regulator n=1 Tax=Spiroplasma endosymbiont of Aspidapion aeneum TaxID=3066276 RepID=UPI00313E485A